MSHWIRVAAAADCSPGTGLEVLAGDRIIALFNVDGTLLAIDGVCAHEGGPLSKGSLCGAAVTCPWHGWQYDVRSGRHLLNPGIAQQRYEVRVDGDDVSVRIDDEPRVGD